MRHMKHSFIMILVALVFFLTHGRRVPTFYVPSRSRSLSDEAAPPLRAGTTALMSLGSDKWQLPMSSMKNIMRFRRPLPSKSTTRSSESSE